MELQHICGASQSDWLSGYKYDMVTRMDASGSDQGLFHFVQHVISRVEGLREDGFDPITCGELAGDVLVRGEGVNRDRRTVLREKTSGGA